MRPLTWRCLLALAIGLGPDLAWACAVCVDASRADRGFSWAFVGLMLAPFVVAVGVAGTLAAGRTGRDTPDGPRAGMERPGDGAARHLGRQVRDGD
jgi:hypothetical protein